MNIRDADFEGSRLRIVRKGGRIDFVPMSGRMREVIGEELQGRPGAERTEPLFLNREGKRYRCIRSPLATACRLAGIPHCSHHSLRHAYATILREKGEKVETISRLLGHTSPTTTRNIYVHWRDKDVERAAESIRIGQE